MAKSSKTTKSVKLRRPSKWYYFTDNPHVFKVCSYNPVEREYNKDCEFVRIEQLPTGVDTAMAKVAEKFTA